MTSLLYGLLLAGGKSSRMGRDKASMVLGADGLTQACRARGLLETLCRRTYISLREGQSVPEGGEGVSVLRDSSDAEGPLCGILAAFREEPAAAWLVLACDLPFVTAEVLDGLAVRHCEAPWKPFIAYSNVLDGRPEPLCAIYAPAALPVLLRYAADGNFSPRRIMTEENAVLLHLPNGSAAALVNINTPQDMEARDHVGR